MNKFKTFQDSILIELSKRLREHARRLKMSYECTVTLLGHSQAETRIEDGNPYHYPELLDFNIENWSTFKGSLRLSDGRVIREGADLNGVGISVAQLYRRMLKQLNAHAELIALHDRAEKANAVVFNGELVPCEGFKAKHWFGNRETVFLIHTDMGISKWYGANADDALSNASPWISKHKPFKIEVSNATAE